MAGGALTGLDVAILAGGRGKRLRGVLRNMPKILAPVHGRPFLDHMLDRLERDQPRRIVFCLGYLADQVIDRLRRRTKSSCAIEWVVEPEPMGTGGALRHARARLSSNPVLVMNGDTWLDIDLKPFVDQTRDAQAHIAIACAEVDDAARFGAIECDAEGWIRRFTEKSDAPASVGLVNGGTYLFSQSALAELKVARAQSLERDFLQTRPAGSIKAYCGPGKFLDIGTPEALRGAEAMIPAPRAKQAEREPA